MELCVPGLGLELSRVILPSLLGHQILWVDEPNQSFFDILCYSSPYIQEKP